MSIRQRVGVLRCLLLPLAFVAIFRNEKCYAFQLNPQHGNDRSNRLSLPDPPARNVKRMDCVDDNSETKRVGIVENLSSICEATSKGLRSASVGALLVAGTLAFPWTAQIADTATQQPAISIQRSAAWALTEQQMLVDDVWKEVNRQFVDQTFGGLGQDKWSQKRLQAVQAVRDFGPDDQERVYQVIRNMLEPLHDPYTRYLTPDQYDSLTAYATGKTSSQSAGGIGVSLMGDPTTGKIVVVNTVADGPAEAAGIRPGDIVLSVDGDDLEGATAEVVAAKCRGEIGDPVTVAVKHEGKGSVEQLTVKRASVANSNAVQASTQTINGKKVGIIRVPSFSQETVSQVLAALKDLKSVSSLVVDVRGNAGGYMPAGVDVAKLFLKAQARVVSEVNKSGRSTIYINDGVGSDTTTPLYILVDQRTASASEILTAALQDNKRATVVGTVTFGKGRIQNVQPLSEGGVAVTKAKYITPEGRDIQGVGITPDKRSATCGPRDSASTCLSGVL